MLIEINDKVFEEYKKQRASGYFNMTDKEIERDLNEYLNSKLWERRLLGSEKDSCTGAQSRYILNMYIQKLLKESEEQKVILSFLVINLKNLRNFNESYGLYEGDKLIKKVSDKLRSIYNDEIVYRFGGGEFVVDLSGMEYKEVEDLVEIQLKKAIVTIYLKMPLLNNTEKINMVNHIASIITSSLLIGCDSSKTGNPEVLSHKYDLEINGSNLP